MLSPLAPPRLRTLPSKSNTAHSLPLSRRPLLPAPCAGEGGEKGQEVWGCSTD